MNVGLIRSQFAQRIWAGQGAQIQHLQYDMTAPSGFLNNAGKVETLYNLGAYGAASDLTQATAGERPTVTTLDGEPSGGYSIAIETLAAVGCPSAAIVGDPLANWEVDIVFSSAAVSTLAFLSWGHTTDSNPVTYLGTSTTGRLRAYRRANSGSSLTLDSADVTIVPGQKHAATFAFAGGLLNAWFDGVPVITDADWVGSVAATTNNRLMMGARGIGGGVSLGWNGTIQKMNFRAL
jgi:hypothetical protein